MKIYNYSRKALALVAASILVLGMTTASQVRSANPEPERVSDDARLIVNRIPNLGNHVIVDLYIDGVPALPIVYGQTYESLLSPGRHVLSVQASPNPKWTSPSEIVLNVRKGETYSFTAMGDGSGHLILKGA